MPTKRRTLASRIRELAKQDIHRASSLAERGEEFSDFELNLEMHQRMKAQLNEIKSGKLPPYLDIEAGDSKEVIRKRVADEEAWLERSVQKNYAMLAGIFIKAIDTWDYEQLHKIADSVKKLKDFKDHGDKFRAAILGQRSYIEMDRRFGHKPEKLTVRQLAERIGWPEAESENGFWKLRRMAKELGYPLKRSTHRSQK